MVAALVERVSTSADCGNRESISILRILLRNTKFPLFTGFVEPVKVFRLKYAINPMQNTKF